MRILFLTDNFPPEVNAPATRTYEHCIRWVKQGVDVTVITCQPNFPKGKIFDGYKNKLYQKEKVDGITVIRVWSFIAPNSGFLKRVIDFTSYAFMAFFVGLFRKCDIIIGTSPQFFTVISAYLLSVCKRKPWVMEVRDLWPESIAAVGAIKKDSIFYKILSWIERRLYKSADLIIPVTNTFKDYMVSLGIEENKIHVITNGVDKDKFKPTDKNKELLSKLNFKGKFVIGYIGTHGMAHALDFILQSIKEVKNEKIHFVLQGDGSEKDKLLILAKELELTNLTFLPFVSKEKISSYISILDVALVNLKRSDTFKSVIPSKIFENACMQKPLLHGVEGESMEIINKYGAGVCFEPENKNSFLSAIEEITKTEKYTTFQTGCLRLAEDYNRDKLANDMLEKVLYLKK